MRQASAGLRSNSHNVGGDKRGLRVQPCDFWVARVIEVGNLKGIAGRRR